MKPTKRDPNGQHTLEALGCLEAAKDLRKLRATMVQDAMTIYDWKGPLTSGCEQTHWPEEIKDLLRVNAQAIRLSTDHALKCWRQAGRRNETLRAILPQYHVEGSRY